MKVILLEDTNDNTTTYLRSSQFRTLKCEKDSHKLIGKENIAQDEHFNSDGWVQGDYTQPGL